MEWKGKSLLIIQIVDVSKNLMYDKVSAKSEFLSLINATVSHEMRNPLNSILNQNLNLKSIMQTFGESILDLEGKMKLPRTEKAALVESFVEKMKDVYKQARSCQKMQRSSSKMLNHQINCMMDYASITSGTFKHNTKQIFDVKEAL
mmetsp:Transcript_36509/g.56045  ORF Transcript_36509/g.56045 Transcript_36509/m.56045 type:complete len:147 (+) Transcript_36509:1651-2091(+)